MRTLMARALVAVAAVATLMIPASKAWSATPSTAQQAARVHSMAQLETASPAVRRAIQTPVTKTHVVTLKNQATGKTVTLTSPSASPTVREAPSYPCGSDGCNWQALWPPGCWTVTNAYNWKNIYGWVLLHFGYVTTNWCWNGYRDYTTPGAYAVVSTHWGWTYCGRQNDYNGWVAQGWGWQTSGNFKYALGTCVYVNPHTKFVGGQFWGNGHWNWWVAG